MSTRWIWSTVSATVREDRRLEPGLFAGDDIDADREQRDDVFPVGASFGLASEAGLLVGHDHFHAGHHGATGVAHRPGDLTGSRLGE